MFSTTGKENCEFPWKHEVWHSAICWYGFSSGAFHSTPKHSGRAQCCCSRDQLAAVDLFQSTDPLPLMKKKHASDQNNGSHLNENHPRGVRTAGTLGFPIPLNSLFSCSLKDLHASLAFILRRSKQLTCRCVEMCGFFLFHRAPKKFLEKLSVKNPYWNNIIKILHLLMIEADFFW